MKQSFEKDFNIFYENDATKNYLILRPVVEKKLVDYQAQMLLSNKISGILDFNINYIGNNLNCFYDVTSKCSLVSFMARKQFSRDEFLITMLKIINNIFNIKNYLLYDNNILLDESYIYVEPESMSIYFVYLPFAVFENDFKAFFINLIVKLAKFQDEESDNYIQKILEAIKNELFSLSNLKNLIENLLGEAVKNQTSKIRSADPPEEKEIKCNKIEKDREKSYKTRHSKLPKVKSNKETVKGIVKIPNSDNNNQKVFRQPEEISKKSAKNITGSNNKINKILLFQILLQPVFLIVFLLVVTGNFVKASGNPKASKFILTMVFVSLDILLMRIINGKKGKGNEISNYGPLRFISDKMTENINVTTVEDEIADSGKEENNSNATNENCNGETVVLRRIKPEGVPYLKEKDGEEVIRIDKKSILIGRMDSFVDHVINSNAIGKIHAEILYEDGAFYVMDCNSKNGTFLNDSRIVPNTKNKVKNDDVIRFANKEYTLVCLGIS